MKNKLIIIFLTFLLELSGTYAGEIKISPSCRFASLILTSEEYADWDDDVFDDYSNELYQKFNDDFDFIVYVLNEPTRPSKFSYSGISHGISSFEKGIGTEPYDYTSNYGSDGRLQRIIHLPYSSAIESGPFLHEILHRWANDAIPTIDWNNSAYSSHWGITGGSTPGQLGGFQESSLVKNVDNDPTKYNVPYFGLNANGGNSIPYNELELYLMGMIPASDVSPFSVFQNINSYTLADDYSSYTFFSDNVVTYDSNKLTDLLGERTPDYTTSQKEFNVLFVVVTDTELSCEEWNTYDLQIERFCRKARNGNNNSYNFWEATNGIGSLTAKDIDKSLKVKDTNIIEVTDYTGNDTLSVGSSFNFSWSTSFGKTVTIDLYKNGCYYKTIANSVSIGAKSYTWLVDVDNPYVETDRYTIKVTSDQDETVYGYSRDAYTILSKTVEIKGKVLDKDGNPIAGATITNKDVVPVCDQSQTRHFMSNYVGTYYDMAEQTFVPAMEKLSRLDIYISRTGHPGNLIVGIKDTNNAIKWKTTLSEDRLVEEKTIQCVSINITEPINLVIGDTYTIFLYNPTVNYIIPNIYYWGLISNGYDKGESSYSASYDYAFSTWSDNTGSTVSASNGSYTFIVPEMWSGNLTAISESMEFEVDTYVDLSSSTENDIVEKVTSDNKLTLSSPTNDILIYPNIVEDGFRIENTKGSVSYSICSLTGNTIKTGTLSADGYVSSEELQPGVYTVLVQQGDTVKVFKLIRK